MSARTLSIRGRITNRSEQRNLSPHPPVQWRKPACVVAVVAACLLFTFKDDLLVAVYGPVLALLFGLVAPLIASRLR